MWLCAHLKGERPFGTHLQRKTRCLLMRQKTATLAILNVRLLLEEGDVSSEPNGGELRLSRAAAIWPRAQGDALDQVERVPEGVHQ